ncbi:ankyrin repeat and KH domain-containing protein 1, partial [Staphylotrichum tortipilum]
MVTALWPHTLAIGHRSGTLLHAGSFACSVRRSPSPCDRFFDFGSYPIHDDLGLMRNLPFFRLLDLVERPALTAVADHPLPGQRSRRAITTPSWTTMYDGLLAVASSIFPEISASRVVTPFATKSLADIILRFQQFVPERYAGDLSEHLGWVLGPTQPVSTTLPWLFSMAAYLATNNALEEEVEGLWIDGFLQWTIDHAHAESLARFMTIQTPTVHAFANVLLESAIRIKNKEILHTLLDYGVKMDSRLDSIAAVVGDIDLTNRILSTAEPASLARTTELLPALIRGRHFDVVKLLLEMSRGGRSNLWGEALHVAVRDENIEGLKFLLKVGADPSNDRSLARVFKYTVESGKPAEMVALFLEHGADVMAELHGLSILEWAALHRRSICGLLKKWLEPAAVGFLLGDLLYAAGDGPDALATYIIARRPEVVSDHQMAEALQASIVQGHIGATSTLLQHGVDPDGPSLDTPPLVSGLRHAGIWREEVVDLLLEHGANTRRPELLDELGDMPCGLLRVILASGVDLEHRERWLVQAAEYNNRASAEILIQSGVDVNTPGLRLNPLQSAAWRHHADMVQFLIGQGADVNAPAHP